MKSNGTVNNKKSLTDIIFIIIILVSAIMLILSLIRILPWYFLPVSIVLNLIAGLGKYTCIKKYSTIQK